METMIRAEAAAAAEAVFSMMMEQRCAPLTTPLLVLCLQSSLRGPVAHAGPSLRILLLRAHLLRRRAPRHSNSASSTCSTAHTPKVGVALATMANTGVLVGALAPGWLMRGVCKRTLEPCWKVTTLTQLVATPCHMHASTTRARSSAKWALGARSRET